jgi:translation initiation factor 6
MATRVSFENSSEIGVFAQLTNKFCMVSSGGSENFYSVFEQELSPHMPVIHASIGQCKTVGVLTVANSKGLLVPSITTDMELQVIRNCLPESVRI